MLNRAIAICLLTAVISSCLSQFFIYAGFKVNQSYIAQKLCINKARPWMHCNGHCYLMKKLKQEQEQEKKQEKEDQKNTIQTAAFTQTVNSLALVPQTVKTVFAPEQHFSLPQSASSIFQPPRV